MDNYTAFFGFSMFVMGMVAGRLSMAIQYALMKPKPTKKARALDIEGRAREEKSIKDAYKAYGDSEDPSHSGSRVDSETAKKMLDSYKRRGKL